MRLPPPVLDGADQLSPIVALLVLTVAVRVPGADGTPSTRTSLLAVHELVPR